MKKQFLKSKSVCKVTFQLPKEAVEGSKKVALLGDFNNWDPNEAYILRARKDGSYATTVELPLGKNYHFRYLVDDHKWINDWAADRYETSPIHPHIVNSVISLTEADDLTKIEGIGPKIREVLEKADIRSFRSLSETSLERLHNMLEQAGQRFKTHDPSTWPEQAALAAKGAWEKLEAWQKTLKGGRNNKPRKKAK